MKAKQALRLVMSAAGIAAAGSALAMGPGGPGAMGAGCGPMGAAYGSHRHGERDHQAMSGRRLESMKQALKITAEQESAWQAFEAAAKKQSEGMGAMRHDREADRNLAVPDRMAKHLEGMKQHLAAMEAVQAALGQLYAVLTAEQKAVADREFGPRQMRHRRT